MLKHEDLIWTEKYRPKTVEDCILPARLKIPFQKYVDEKRIDNLLLTGGPGVGKTTIAKAMCEEVGCDYMVISGSEETGVDTVRTKIKTYASSMSLMGGTKVIIIDEADYLTPNAQAAFRFAIEEFSKNCNFIFTCNYRNKIMEAISSRCSVVEFKVSKDERKEILNQFFKRIKSILDAEEITYDSAVVAKFIDSYFPDFRRTINELQRFSKFGTLDKSILSHVGSVQMKELSGYLKAGDFLKVREWAATCDVDQNTVYKELYKNLSSIMSPKSVPAAVILLADYMYKAAFVSDPEVNMVACLTELMVNCEWEK